MLGIGQRKNIAVDQNCGGDGMIFQLPAQFFNDTRIGPMHLPMLFHECALYPILERQTTQNDLGFWIADLVLYLINFSDARRWQLILSRICFFIEKGHDMIILSNRCRIKSIL